MLQGWPIRNKLLLGVGLLLMLIGILTASACYGLYAYRGLVRSLRDRSDELPLATQLGQNASEMQSLLSELRGIHTFAAIMQREETWGETRLLRNQFEVALESFQETLAKYRERLNANVRLSDSRIANGRERETLAQIEAKLVEVEKANLQWQLDDARTGNLAEAVTELHQLAVRLPTHLHRRLHDMAAEVRLQYRTAITLTWVTSVASLLVFGLLVRLFYQWIFRPLQTLIEGSRKVAAGDFQHRIELDTQDEMSELADAMNEMTRRFQATRDDLDRQVQERTKQVVRSEQLASVGFLAAGVAHEINNPLASIALCSESLEGRIGDLLTDESEQHEVVCHYLQMIQEEAFRCKQITEKLLDFSRMGDVEKHRTDLRELAAGVIEMIQHLGCYQSKTIELAPGDPVFADVNPQEMKQVVLNLVTNGLDSLDAGGTVKIDVCGRGDAVELVVTDNGYGMTEDVLQHLFEPFYTRRRGGHGTGLGLSITYRIVADHDGHIEASSEGEGKGSKLVVTLPQAEAAASWNNPRAAA
jgi:two-component system NtrC family sensor kinase